MQSCLRVDDKHQEIGLADCLDDLTPNLEVHREMWIVEKPACIDEPELTAVPFRASEVTVTCGAGLSAHNCTAVSDYAIDECRLAYIGAPDEGDYWNIHAATASSSLPRMSMKSYDGCTGIGKVSLSSSKATSSRKMRSSLIDSAGMR